jgi:hypothetical protein
METNSSGGISLPVAVLLGKPSAYLPVALSSVALAVVLANVVLHGTTREADEGAAAHCWQLLMAAQLPLILFFAIRWLPRHPQQALSILALQTGAFLAALAPVWWFGL